MEGGRLHIAADQRELIYNLDDYRRVLVLGVGKAAAPMALAMEDILGGRLTDGCVVVKYGHCQDLRTICLLEAGHPLPDAEGVRAAQRIVGLAEQADGDCLVINLISGGGSALLPLPAAQRIGNRDLALSLADKQQTTSELLACGASIGEINCVRKHLSAVKGGRLVASLAPATSVNLILSDVVGDDLSSIASGLTVPDPTTYGDAWAILDKYDLHAKVPGNVVEFLAAGARGEIPESLKKDEHAFSLTENVLIGTNRLAMMAAAKEAENLGYAVSCLTSRMTGDAQEIARMLAAVAADVGQSALLSSRPACILSGGEPVVVVRGSGKGGRNQQMALAYLAEIASSPLPYQGVAFLAAATDGTDGPTDAAGAFADLEILARCREKQLALDDFLSNNDAYNFFAQLDGLFITGPTNTNVCDLHITLIGDH